MHRSAGLNILKKSGAVDRDRTGDLFLTKEVLYQLSYNGLRDGGQGRIRTFVRRKDGQIYSLLALTTHPPVQLFKPNHQDLGRPSRYAQKNSLLCQRASLLWVGN